MPIPSPQKALARIRSEAHDWVCRATLALVLPAFLLLQYEASRASIIRRHDVPDSLYVNLAREYTSVAHLNLPVPSGAADGEGTLIGPRWVLTAAHLASEILPGSRVTIGGTDYLVDTVFVHPGWDDGAHDIALVRLASSVVDVEPARLYRGAEELNEVVVLVGYGDQGTGLTGPTTNDWQVRTATNRVDEATAFWLKMRFDAPGDPRVTPLEGVSGPGDSGGPAYLADAKGEVIVGVSGGQSTRATGGQPGRYGVTEYYTRVSRYLEWIEGVAGPL